MTAPKGKTLQLRVNADYARRFAAVAKARGLSESALLKVGADKVLAEAEADIDALKAQVREQYEAAKKQALAELDALVAKPDTEDAPPQQSLSRRTYTG
ncbi:MAG TPA: hypothetical protein VMU34_08495 [Mycobacterium sp.]|nr:hypothetical protein [Mycobacterium sp.]